MNQALKQVRADLVEATQSAIKVVTSCVDDLCDHTGVQGHAKEHENDQTVQEIVDKQTAGLKVVMLWRIHEMHVRTQVGSSQYT